MQHAIRNIHAVALALGLTLAAATAQAQSPGEMAAQMAKLGGAAHALAGKCGDYTAADLDRMKRQQRDQHRAAGWDVAKFDAAFAQAQREAEGRWDGMSAGQRRQACDQARAMGGFGG